MIIPKKQPCPCGYIGSTGRGCPKFIVPPVICCVEGSLTEEEADELIEVYKHAARLKWLLDNPVNIGVLQFKPRNKRVEWIDAQMVKPRNKRM